MAELGLSCLPVGMTSAGKNVYPVSTPSIDADEDDITAKTFEGNGWGDKVTGLSWESTNKKGLSFPELLQFIAIYTFSKSRSRLCM